MMVRPECLFFFEDRYYIIPQEMGIDIEEKDFKKIFDKIDKVAKSNIYDFPLTRVVESKEGAVAVAYYHIILRDYLLSKIDKKDFIEYYLELMTLEIIETKQIIANKVAKVIYED